MRLPTKSAAFMFAAVLTIIGAGHSAVCGQHIGHSPCGLEHCPPAYRHYQQGGPKLHWKKACPLPVCDPCNLPHFGYYQPCWRQWPFPPDYSHCPVPPAAAAFPAHGVESYNFGSTPPSPYNGAGSAPRPSEQLPLPGPMSMQSPLNF